MAVDLLDCLGSGRVMLHDQQEHSRIRDKMTDRACVYMCVCREAGGGMYVCVCVCVCVCVYV